MTSVQASRFSFPETCCDVGCPRHSLTIRDTAETRVNVSSQNTQSPLTSAVARDRRAQLVAAAAHQDHALDLVDGDDPRGRELEVASAAAPADAQHQEGGLAGRAGEHLVDPADATVAGHAVVADAVARQRPARRAG